MTRDVPGGIIIETELPQQCDLCGVIAELRPYGPNGEAVCFDCGMIHYAASEAAFQKRIAGVGLVIVVSEGDA